MGGKHGALVFGLWNKSVQVRTLRNCRRGEEAGRRTTGEQHASRGEERRIIGFRGTVQHCKYIHFFVCSGMAAG